MARPPSFHALRKRIQQNQKLGLFLLEQLHKQALKDRTQEAKIETISAAYIKLSQTQAKWCELELALLREHYKTLSSENGTATHAITPEPISSQEWELIAHHSAAMMKATHG